MSQIPYNPFDPAVKADPYPLYARLRDEAPVYRMEGLGLTAVSRYEDVLAILKNPSGFSSRALRDLFAGGAAATISDDADITGETLIGTDPPVHTRLRKIVNRAFTPSHVRALEPRVRQVTDELVSAVERRGTCELMSDVAIPLPLTIIAEILGMEPERRHDFKRWSDDFLMAGTGRPTPEQAERIRVSDEELGQWIDQAVAERRVRPGDDLISAMVAAEQSEEVMTEEEVGNLIVLLLIAGNETTANLLGNAMLALFRNPQVLAALQRDPELIPIAVEEALRYDSPVQLTLRRATRDVELAGGKIARDEVVAVLLASANRDPRVFPEPNRFDLSRDPRNNVAFGFGTHFCVGAPLARLEASVALEALLGRLHDLEWVEEPIEYTNSLLVRGPKQVKLRYAS